MDATCSLEMFAKQYVTHIIESTATKLEKERAIEREDIGDTMFSAMKSLCGRITPTEMTKTLNEGLKTAKEFGQNLEAGDTIPLQLKFDEDLDVRIGCFVQAVIDTAKEQVKQEIGEKQGEENSCKSNTGLGRNEEDDTTAGEEERIRFFGVFRNNENAKLKEAVDRQKKCGNGLTEEDVATFMQIDLKSRSKTPTSITQGKKANHRADNDVEKVFFGTDVQYLHRTKTSETEYYHFYKELANERVNESYQKKIKEKGRPKNAKKHDKIRRPDNQKVKGLDKNRRYDNQKKEILDENTRSNEQKNEVLNTNRMSENQKKESHDIVRRYDNPKKESLLRRIMSTISGIQKKKEKNDQRTILGTGSMANSMADSLDHLSSIGKGTDVTESLSELQRDMTEDELDFNCDDIEEPPRPTLQPFFTKQQADVIISQPEPELVPKSERKEKRRFRALTWCFRS